MSSAAPAKLRSRNAWRNAVMNAVPDTMARPRTRCIPGWLRSPPRGTHRRGSLCAPRTRARLHRALPRGGPDAVDAAAVALRRGGLQCAAQDLYGERVSAARSDSAGQPEKDFRG